MAIDEAKLETMIQELLTKDQQILQQHISITEIVTTLRTICMEKTPKYNELTGAKTNQTVDVRPIDPQTQATMTDARRLEIYNIIMPKAEGLLL